MAINIVDVALIATMKIRTSDHEDLNLINSEASHTQTTLTIDSSVTIALASLLVKRIASNGISAQSANKNPSDDPLVNVTRETAAGEIKGARLPKKAN